MLAKVPDRNIFGGTVIRIADHVGNHKSGAFCFGTSRLEVLDELRRRCHGLINYKRINWDDLLRDRGDSLSPVYREC